MSEREKALEAALRDVRRDLREYLANNTRTLAVDMAIIRINAALAMPATVDGADFLRGWKAGRDAAERAVVKLIKSIAHDTYTGRLYALNKSREAIRSLTPPEDAP